VFQSAPFDESFPTAAAEDREWCERFAASGYALRFVPAACVVHQPDLTLSSFLGRQVRYGEGAYRLRMRRGAPVRLEPAGFYVALIRHGFAQGLATGLLVGAAQVATAFGFLAGWAAQQRDGGATRDRPDGSTSGGDAP
jgi:GT2 family glycosyltransferase